VAGANYRQMRLANLQKLIVESEAQDLTFNETVAKVEDVLLGWGLSWHTRRDYLKVLKLK